MQTDVTHRRIHTAAFATEAAEFIIAEARKALSARGTFRLGLAGGNTPRKIHAELARLGADLPWEKVQITFGDERCVPPDHADSNYRMARESLFEVVSIPAENILRMRGEIDQEAAAAEYESALAERAAAAGESRYVHDFLLLGLGPDGHTASLFPGSPAVEETERNVLAVIGQKPPPQRISLTFPLINASRAICFLVGEADKHQVVEEVIAGDPRHPASKVRAATWILGYPQPG
ncbi:MAG TPA: 6-phosphogluconolactonase [Chthoniobacteraceae bacterium]|jgi:6-phosphogluconolactonase